MFDYTTFMMNFLEKFTVYKLYYLRIGNGTFRYVYLKSSILFIKGV